MDNSVHGELSIRLFGIEKGTSTAEDLMFYIEYNYSIFFIAANQFLKHRAQQMDRTRDIKL